MSRRMHLWALLICCTPLVTAVARGAEMGDPCATLGDVAEALITLESSHLNENSVFIAVFKIRNLARDRIIRFNAFGEGDAVRIVRPERSIEYLDGVSGEWRPVLDLPGTFPPRPNKFSIGPGQTAYFSTVLVSKDLANNGARVLRLLIRSAEPKLCFISTPFRAYPAPEEVKGFESVSRAP